jgi:N,N'-diacetyllegionaminate synthase
MDFISKKINFNSTNKIHLIGEIGVNHNKNLKTLFQLIDVGISSGVDIIKLQRFNSELEISKFAPSAEYQKKNFKVNKQLSLAKKLELPDEWIFKAYEYCKKKRIGFLCAAFDHESVDFISDKLKCSSIKSPSSEINNKILLKHMAKKFKSIIISTGASTMDECLLSKKWVKNIDKNLELLFMHCVSEYPSPMHHANLNAIKSMKKKLKVPIGLSDHTDNIATSILSIENKCVLIEKHFTLDKKMKGPDHNASLEPKELKLLSNVLKNYRIIMGSGIKTPQISEKKNRSLIRKSAVCAKKYLKENSIIQLSDMNFKRPFILGSINPENYEKFIGKKIKKKIYFDKPFLIKNLK